MKTTTAPWDYKRNTVPAPFNDFCTKCGRPSYSGIEPSGQKFYSCPTCGIVLETVEDLSLIQDAKKIVACRELAISQPTYAEYHREDMEHDGNLYQEELDDDRDRRMEASLTRNGY